MSLAERLTRHRVQYFDDAMAQLLSSRYARKFNRITGAKIQFVGVSVIKTTSNTFACVERFLPGWEHCVATLPVHRRHTCTRHPGAVAGWTCAAMACVVNRRMIEQVYLTNTTTTTVEFIATMKQRR